MARMSAHPIIVALGALISALGMTSARAQAPPIVKGVCFPTSEARDEIKAHRLLEPFVALKSAAASAKAEALSAKLCRLGEEYVYEIALLHPRDGRLVHVVMNAVTGKLVNTRISREAPPRT